MKIKKVKFNKNLDFNIKKAVGSNLESKVLLEDEHRGVLFGEISKLNKTSTYILSQNGKETLLFYHDLKELYVVKD